MFKKITVLAIAVGLVAALSLPASASATWKHHNTAIQQDVQLGFTGTVKFDTGNGGAECQFTVRTKFLAMQTTGLAETFAAHPTSETSCKGYSTYAFCQTHNLTPQAPNWTIHTGQWETTETIIHGGKPGDVTVKGTGVSHSAILITTEHLTAQPTGAFCPGKQIYFQSGTIAAIPNQPNTFSSVQLNGTLKTFKETSNGQVDQENVRITGTLEIEAPEQRGTYSI